MQGFVLLHREFLQWGWFDDERMVKLFIYLLLKVNHKDVVYKGIPIKRGQTLTSLNLLVKELNMPKQRIRTCLDKLKKTGEINTQTNTKYTIITICNYDVYQDFQNYGNTQSNTPSTHHQHNSNTQLTSNNNEENEKYEKNEEKKEALTGVFLDFLKLYNDCLKRNRRVLSERAKKQLKARLKDGYELYDFEKALRNVVKDEFHAKNNFNHITPEFITRQDKIEKFLDFQDKKNGFDTLKNKDYSAKTFS
ncbi:hypothetical protein GF340_04110 [Candidatus Peregrinibacteria bacterium]|nr:hypothetical protein [Candidatus Peregrinibacteria bacterium]